MTPHHPTDGHEPSGRLSTLAAAWVIARRDFTAILLSRTFLFFLLGPLFPVLVGALAGSVGKSVEQSAERPAVGVVMSAADADAMVHARELLADRLGQGLPRLVVIHRLAPGERSDPVARLAGKQGNIAAILSGSPSAPVLTGPPDQIEAWAGDVALIAAEARQETVRAWPPVELHRTASSRANERTGRLRTAQAAQTLLFLLTMMLAGMVLSNLVEEKGNKIIEVLAAAIPMEAVFFGKLFAMLGISLVGIATWGAAAGAVYLFAGSAMPALPEPALGWSMLIGLGILYFSMAYLLLGSVFLSIGSLASTVREVQTLSMPVTMIQLLLFFFATYAMTKPGTAVEILAVMLPFSSPFAMLARAAQDPAILPHLAALLWQAAWLFLLVRAGSRLFRKRVMKSGSPQRSAGQRRFYLPWRRSGRSLSSPRH